VPATRVLFVTGTDTDVGKTVVAAGLLRAAARQGLRSLALKPVAAGCRVVDGALVNDDALLLMREAGIALDYADVNPVALEPAIAPHIAAERAGVDLSCAALLEHCRARLEVDADLALVEGAGGWLVPLNDRETLADLCEQLGADVLLVVAMRLGCINHALLSAGEIARRGLRLAGWVANCVDPKMPALEANLATLDQRLEAPCIGRVPFAGAEDPVAVAAEHLDLALLLGASG
jgi:dethiobiotin synthetase